MLLENWYIVEPLMTAMPIPDLVQERYLEEAIDAVLLNKQIQTHYQPPVGCSIKWKQHG